MTIHCLTVVVKKPLDYWQAQIFECIYLQFSSTMNYNWHRLLYFVLICHHDWLQN